MENLVTPSERAQSLINPHTRSRSVGSAPRDRLGLILKIVFGSPIPVLLTLYVISMAVSENAISLMGSLLVGFTFLYILVDRFTSPREFSFFGNMVDVPLLIYLGVCLIGILQNWQSDEAFLGLKNLSWIFAYYLIMYSFFLFPGLNRLFRTMVGVVPLMSVFVVWQRFFGLHVNLSIVPAGLAEAVAGIDTVGFFNSVAPYGFVGGVFVAFATAALMVPTTRYKSFKFLIMLALAVTWLSLVTVQSIAVLAGPLVAAAVILLYCKRSYFFILMVLCLGLYFALPKNHWTRDSFSAWMERGVDVGQEKHDVARAEIAIFGDHPWLGVGYSSVRPLLPAYFKKLEINRDDSNLSSNNYFAILSSTGILGFACYMTLSLLFLLKTHRLWLEIPQTHYWHRAFVMGTMGAQVVFHTMGLYQNMLDCLAAMLVFAFFLAVISYLNESYGRGIIPDDYSL